MDSENSYIKDIKSEDLIVGSPVKTDYYSYKGDLLIKSGTVIENVHIESLKSRFHDDLYILFEEDDDEIEFDEEVGDDVFGDLDVLEQAYKDDLESGTLESDVVSGELVDDGDETEKKSDDDAEDEDEDDEIDDEFGDEFDVEYDDDEDSESGYDVTIVNKEFDHISFGIDGLDQLIESNESKMIYNYVSRIESYSNPVGFPQKNKVVQISKEDRSKEYKTEIHNSYNTALKKVKEFMTAVASGSEKVDVFSLKNIVTEIIDIFNRDRSIMINMSNAHYKPNDYIFKHALNVAIISINISLSYGYSKNQITDIAMGAILADVGMLLVPKEIVDKEGPLDKEEMGEIYKHPIIGAQLISRILKIPPVVQFVAYQHHERINGLGYPHGKNTLHNYAKIVQIADIYDALISKRPHREAYSPFKAMEIISNMVNIRMIEMDIFKAFVEFTSVFPIGSLVRLNDDRIAKVVAANSGVYSKPIVYIVIDEAGRALKDNEVYEVDLLESNTVSIVSSLVASDVQKINIMRGF